MQALEEARMAPGKTVLVFEDEASFYRQPSQGRLWSWVGRRQPKMRYSHRANTCARLVAFMDAVTGRVVHRNMAHVKATRLAKCIHELSANFPSAEKIYLVWDNWPVHAHPLVQEALHQEDRIHVVTLPTYAPWLNYIEKLWRLLRQEVAHAHSCCDDFREFISALVTKLDEFAAGSHRLLRYCGLSS